MTTAIGDLLARFEPRSKFVTHSTVGASDLCLHVEGVGQIDFPISQKTVRRLCALAAPAAYGLGSKTLVDTAVRDTSVVPASKVTIDERRWGPILEEALGRIAAELGLPIGALLRAQFHDLLIYGPGQFFLPHQDTEKTDGMIGTLVVELPSSYAGGDVVVRQNREVRTFRGGRSSAHQDLSLLAFYADCHHEVRPITRGVRVVLTYNLILEGDTRAPVAERAVDALASALRAYFETPRPRPYDGERQTELPDRLVVLLDHQYTERGLSWARLKHPDAARVAAMVGAADRIGAKVALALAELHETYSAFGADPGTTDLGDLLSSELVLDRWLDSGEAKPKKVAASIDLREVVSTIDSRVHKPFNTEYEGYMGNYGETSDRWYRRAALVVWPEARAFEIKAKASASWALSQLEGALKRKDLGQAQDLTRRLLPFWRRVADGEEAALFERALGIASGLVDPELAAGLLEPFSVEQVRPAHAAALAALLSVYGLAWCEARINAWAERRYGGQASIRALHELVGPLSESGGEGLAMARGMVRREWRLLKDEAAAAAQIWLPSELPSRLASSGGRFVELLECTLITDQPEIHAEILSLLESRDHPVALPLGVIEAAIKGYPSEALEPLGISALITATRARVEAELAAPLRAPNDWSIVLPGDCTCELCQWLTTFLIAPHTRQAEWPLAKAGRAHVHGRLDRHELPVTHETRRVGSPYTLVLTKTDDVHRREAKARAALAAALERLDAAGQAVESAVQHRIKTKTKTSRPKKTKRKR